MDVFGDDNAGAGGTIDLTALHEATRHRYLNYALSVITSRALPDVRDGLSPQDASSTVCIATSSCAQTQDSEERTRRW